MCNSVRTPFKRAIELTCSSSVTKKYYFATDATLESAKQIVAIQAYAVSDAATSPLSNSALQADSVFTNSFLTIVSGNDEVVSKIPLSDLRRSANNGNFYEVDIPNGISVTKSYIETTVAPDTAKVWLFSFHYHKQ